MKCYNCLNTVCAIVDNMPQKICSLSEKEHTECITNKVDHHIGTMQTLVSEKETEIVEIRK